MNELSPRTRALLGDYKIGVLPSPRQDVANWAAIAQRIAVDEPPLFDDIEPRRRPWWPWVTGSAVVVVAAAAAVLLLVDGGWIGSAAIDDDPSMDAAPYEWSRDASGGRAAHRSVPRQGKRSGAAPEPDVASEREPVESIESTKVEAAAAPEEAAGAIPAPARARTGRGSSRRSAPAADELAAEASSLARARAELRDGRPGDALRRLARHARRFPQGALAKERRVLEILARCEAGQRARARREAQRFIRDNPGSPLTARVRGICPQ